MNTRSRLVLGSIVGALAIHLVLVACSSGGASFAPEDGGILADVANALRDVGRMEVRDANAGGRVIEVACDQETRGRGNYAPDGGVVATFENTSWSAVVPNVTLNPQDVPRITVYTCDPEMFGTPPNPCPAGWTCDQTGFTYPRNNCVSALGAATIDANGRVIIACGFRSVNVNTAVTTETGTRYRRAFVRVE